MSHRQLDDMTSQGTKPKILHLSYDLRRRRGEEVTSAVRDLILASKKFSEPSVISLVRVPVLTHQGFKSSSPNWIEINSFGLPFGIFLRHHLNCSMHWIENADQKLRFLNQSFSLIHAHKLTFEGYIGNRLAQKYHLPLVTTIRQTDFGVIKYKPFYRQMYRSILLRSSKIIYLVPYMVGKLRKYFDEETFSRDILPKMEFLPNIIKIKGEGKAGPVDKNQLLTIVRMTRESVHRKNIYNLFLSLKNTNMPDLKLKVIGDGPYIGKVKKWISQLKMENQIELLGRIPNEQIDKYYRQASAFVLPSKSESFGMVYAEALLNGTPILYSRGTGFDGLFEGVGPMVDPYDLASIQNGIVDIIKNNEIYRQNIARMQQRRMFDIFYEENVASKYQKIIESVIRGKDEIN